MAAGQDGEDSSPSATRATTSCAAVRARASSSMIEFRGVTRSSASSGRRTSAERIARHVRGGRVRRRTLFFARFRSVISQIPTAQQLIPAEVRQATRRRTRRRRLRIRAGRGRDLAELLPRNIAVQIFRALLENHASFYGAQMSAMDNATRNAGDMINEADHHLQPHPPGEDHQGTDRDHLRRRGALIAYDGRCRHGLRNHSDDQGRPERPRDARRRRAGARHGAAEGDRRRGDGHNPEQLFALGYSSCFGQAILALGKKHGVDGAGRKVTAT